MLSVEDSQPTRTTCKHKLLTGSTQSGGLDITHMELKVKDVSCLWAGPGQHRAGGQCTCCSLMSGSV
jgi:hypothetical protein